MIILQLAGRIILINFIMLLAPALLDIVVVGFMAFTVVCFAVAGIFSALFCYSALPEKLSYNQLERVALSLMIVVLSVCVLLFFMVAPLGGTEYNLPVKGFALTEAIAIVFFWKTKFYQESDPPKQSSNQ